MEIFIDSAEAAEVKEAVSWGVISGVTTNPKLVSTLKGRISLRDKVLEITKLCPGPISVEVTAEDFEGMIAEAKLYSSWSKNIVIKIPMGIQGLKVVNVLERQYGIKTNVTAIMATNQAILAALSGATYASIFFARVGDMGYDASKVISDTANLFRAGNLKAKIISGSIRHLMDINRSFEAGAHIVTVPFNFLKQMSHNLRTVETISEFNNTWREMKEKGLLVSEDHPPKGKHGRK